MVIEIGLYCFLTEEGPDVALLIEIRRTKQHPFQRTTIGQILGDKRPGVGRVGLLGDYGGCPSLIHLTDSFSSTDTPGGVPDNQILRFLYSCHLSPSSLTTNASFGQAATQAGISSPWQRSHLSTLFCPESCLNAPRGQTNKHVKHPRHLSSSNLTKTRPW